MRASRVTAMTAVDVLLYIRKHLNLPAEESIQPSDVVEGIRFLVERKFAVTNGDAVMAVGLERDPRSGLAIPAELVRVDQNRDLEWNPGYQARLKAVELKRGSKLAHPRTDVRTRKIEDATPPLEPLELEPVQPTEESP